MARGEVVGGIVVMEQDQNVLAITRGIDQRLATLRTALPKGVEIVTTYDRAAWIWATLKQFMGTLLSELVVLILVTVLFLGNFRSAVGPIAILLLSTLFTVLPLAGFGQTINLFSLAGLCIAIGAIEDATIVIVENCAAELALHPGLRGRDAAADHPALDRPRRPSAALLARHHRRLVPAGVLPRGARGTPVRSTRLQQDVRGGAVDAADRSCCCRSSWCGCSSGTSWRRASTAQCAVAV